MTSTVDTLRFTTAGSVDDGKSTLIGRLLFDTKSILEDQLTSIENTTTKRGGSRVDLSLLTDGLTAEREQGITIDVAYRYFTTTRRRFIIADTPGHEQYTRNMVTGASTADLSVILVDAGKGLQTQSRRHAIIASLLGIPHVVLAINKMDLVKYDQAVFNQIKAEFIDFCRTLDFATLDFIPVSALEGDMIVDRGEKLDWYRGPTLLELLETTTANTQALGEFRFPVQLVARTKLGERAEFRGYMGRIESGRVSVGDKVVVLPAGIEAHIREIVTYDGSPATAVAPQSVTLLLDRQVDVSRGDLFAAADKLPTVTSQITANLAWLSTQGLDPARRYLIKHTTQSVRAVLEGIDFLLDVNTLERKTGATTFRLNDIGRVRLKTTRPLMVDAYRANRITGSFILIDEVTNQTVAGGMILEQLEMSKVYLVGAGPGAPDLLTLRAARLLEQAEIVFFDALVHPDTVALAVNAKKVAVGKRARQVSMDQRFINRQLVEAGRHYQRVVRLKGGDPMMFGRAQEEIDALKAAGIEYEVVPGITAALAASAALGVSLTRRGLARTVSFVTPRIGPDEQESDWISAAITADSTVLYMAAGRAPLIASALISAGKSPSLPVAVVENASLENEQRIYTTLAGLTASSLKLSGPAVLCIGAVFAATAAASAHDVSADHESRMREAHASRCQVA